MPVAQSTSAIAAIILCLLFSCAGETPQPVLLRAAPDTLSVDAARTMIDGYCGYYDAKSRSYVRAVRSLS